MDGSTGGRNVVGRLTGSALEAWVTRSCLAQGVPVKVTDVRVVDRVRTLVTGGPGGPGRGGSTVGSPGTRSQAPDGLHPVVVKRGGPRGAGQDHGMVQDGLDDGGLAVKVEIRPLGA